MKKEDDPIDLTEKKILNGSSILKDIQNNDIKPNTTIRSFPGVTTETLKHKLNSCNLDNCKTVILHVYLKATRLLSAHRPMNILF